MMTFTPDRQATFCRSESLGRVFLGTAPTLDTLRRAWGSNAPEDWLYVQIHDLTALAGDKGEMAAEAKRELARVIASGYGFLKVSELMYFFLLLKQGKYGKFYGTADLYSISDALQQFLAHRRECIVRYEREAEQQREAREREESAARAQAFRDQLKAQGKTIDQWLEEQRKAETSPTSAKNDAGL